MSPQPRSRAQKIVRALYFLVANTLIVGAVLELGWRAFVGTGVKTSEVVPAGKDDVPYALHPYFQTIWPPGAGTSRDPRFSGWPVEPPKTAFKPGRFRVMFLGGSTTANRYPFLARAELEQRIGPTTVYVVAYDWHCSLHSLYKFWTYADTLEPDLVVVLDNINDFYRGFTGPDSSLPEYHEDYSHYAGGLYPFWRAGKSRYDGRDVFFAHPSGAFEIYDAHDDGLSGTWQGISEGSALLRGVRRMAARPPERVVETVSMSEEVVLRALPEFRRNLANLALACRTKSVPVVFLTMPWTLGAGRSFLLPGNFFTNDGVHYLDDDGFRLGMRRFNEAVLALADEPHAYALPMHEKLTDPALFTDEVHFELKGQGLEAQALAEFVVEKAILKTPRHH